MKPCCNIYVLTVCWRSGGMCETIIKGKWQPEILLNTWIRSDRGALCQEDSSVALRIIPLAWQYFCESCFTPET